MTQEQVAQKLLVTRQTVSRWEQDKTLPNVHVLKTLSELYDVPIDTFVTQSKSKQEVVGKMKRINYLALFGVIFFNLVLGSSVWITILGLLLALWVTVVAFIASPLILFGIVIAGVQAFTMFQLISCLVLFIIGLVLYPVAKKISGMVVSFGKQYVKYNQKALYA